LVKEENKIFKASFWYLISLLTTKAIGVLTTPIFTRFLSVEDYGIVATFNTWYNTLFVICSLNLSSGIGKAKRDLKDDFNSFIYSLQYLALISTTGIAILFVIFHKYLMPVIGIDVYSVSLMFVTLLLSPIVYFRQIKFKFEYNYKANISITLFTAIGTVFFSLLFIVLFDTRKYLGRILGIILPSVILSCFFWFRSLRNKENKILVYTWKYALNISIPLIIHTLSQRILEQSDQAMITYFCGTSNTGIYSLANQFSMMFVLFTQVCHQIWTPWFFDNVEERKDYTAKMAQKLITVGCYITFMSVVITPEAIKILGTEEYKEGIYVVPLVMIGLLCHYVSVHFINVELYYKKSIYISSCTIIAAICNVCLNTFCIPIWGYIAAAWTTLFSYLLMVLLHASIVKFIIKKEIYNNKEIAVNVAITGLLVVISVLLYNYLIIRLLLGLLITGLFIWKNKEWLLMFKKEWRQGESGY